MKTMSYLTGNLLFDGDAHFTSDATIKVVIEDVTVPNDEETVYEKVIDFDAQALSIFRYLPFELKDFEHDPSRCYQLSAYVDVTNNGKIEKGDYASTDIYPVVTAMEEINVQLSRVTRAGCLAV